MLLDCRAGRAGCPPRQKSRVERRKAKAEPLLTNLRNSREFHFATTYPRHEFHLTTIHLGHPPRHRKHLLPRQVIRSNFILLENGIVLPNNQRKHRTSRAPKDVLPSHICANYCAPCQPLSRHFTTPSASNSHTGNMPNVLGSSCHARSSGISFQLDKVTIIISIQIT